jgi:hypothetical protein
LHYKRTGKGGGYRAPLPFTPPADAYGGSFDLETLTLSYCVPQPSEGDEILPPLDESYTFTQAEIDAGITYVTTPKPASVPSRVSKLALAKAIFDDSGKRLMSLLDLVPAEMRDDVEEFLMLSAYIDRSHPQIEPLGVLLGYDTPEKVDAVFIKAETTEV